MDKRVIEVDELDFQQKTKAAELVAALWRNPKAKRKLLEAQKEVRPDDPAVKELEAVDPLQEDIKALRKQVEDEREARIKAEQEREQNEKLRNFTQTKETGITQLRRDGWTDEGIKGVEKIMDEKGILDPLDAAAIFEKNHPPAMPAVTARTGAWNHMETGETDANDTIKKLIDSKGQSEAITDKLVNEALNEIRQAQSRR